MAGFPFLLVLGTALTAVAYPLHAATLARHAPVGHAATYSTHRTPSAAPHYTHVHPQNTFAVRAAPSVGPVITSHVPRLVHVPTRYIASAPPPIYFVPPSYPPPVPAYAYAPSRAWNFTPVESIVALAGRQDVRLYCPDTRLYYPDTQVCPSPWLKVIP